MILEPYQTESVSEILTAINHGINSVVVVPTGGGKSVIAAEAIRQLKTDKKIIFAAHRIELVNQFSNHLKRLKVRHGILTADTGISDYIFDRIVVCSIDTLYARLRSGKIKPEQAVIFSDEFQHSLAKTHRHVYESFLSCGSVLIGLTATPERLDGKGLSALVSQIIKGPSFKELVKCGRLVYPKIYSTDMPDLSSVTVSQGDFSRSGSFEVIQRTQITGHAIDHYIKHAPGTRAIVFCINIIHADQTAESFRAAGIHAESISSKSEDRDAIIQRFRDGIIRVMVSVDLVSEGFDLPECETAILLRPTQSLVLFLQQVGRVLRASPGKKHATIIDAVGNVWRHGVPWQDREWHLDGRKARESASVEPDIKIARCSSCFACYDASRDCCPFCGAGANKKQRVIKTVDGILRLMYNADIEVMEAEAARIEAEKIAAEKAESDRKDAVRVAVKSAKTKEALQAIAKENGYKPGWVYYWCRLKRIG